jgi:UDP-3-O-[3-hydroxymyristoyl] glucosamine N-acyltransferase
MNYTTADIAEIVDGKLIGSSTIRLEGPGRIEYAQEGEITFLSNPRYAKFVHLTGASCVIVPKDFDVKSQPGRAYIQVVDPYRAFVQVLNIFAPPVFKDPYRAASASIASSAYIAEDSFIGENCVIGANCTIGDRVVLKANVVLYDNVSIGNDTVIHANVTCYDNTRIGEHCILHSGAVIGADGFGNLENPDGSWKKIPQLGNVIIGNNVEIGANTTIDRATLGSTIIGNGVKLDNLIHIAHNVVVGKDTAMAAQAGISGSTKIGERNRIGGQVGVVGHVEIADDVMIMAQSGVARGIPDSGSYFGSPAIESRTAFRQEAALKQLPDLLKEFRALKNQIEQLLKDKEAL